MQKTLASARDLGLAAVVAAGVALISTMAGAWWDHFHKVAAEDVPVHVGKAVAGPGDSQLLRIAEWGVEIELPLTQALPLVSYAGSDGTAIGLTAEDLAKAGPDCQASRNALGAVLRLPKGTSAQNSGGGLSYLVATVGEYDFVYRLAPTACLDNPEVPAGTVNRETSVVREYIGSLRPIAQ